jgi:hypothetical protein
VLHVDKKDRIFLASKMPVGDRRWKDEGDDQVII